jgi:hypothetical protein
MLDTSRQRCSCSTEQLRYDAKSTSMHPASPPSSAFWRFAPKPANGVVRRVEVASGATTQSAAGQAPDACHRIGPCADRIHFELLACLFLDSRRHYCRSKNHYRSNAKHSIDSGAIRETALGEQVRDDVLASPDWIKCRCIPVHSMQTRTNYQPAQLAVAVLQYEGRPCGALR